MTYDETTGLQNSGTDTQLRQVLSHLQIASPAEGDPMCQACGEVIREGDSVTLYLFRPAGRTDYNVGQCRCIDHNDELTDFFTLGTRELVVNGRIGLCRDQATQQTWPVLLAPTVRLISAHDTDGYEILTNDKHNRGTETSAWQYGATVDKQVAKQSDEIKAARTRLKCHTVQTRPIDKEEHQ